MVRPKTLLGKSRAGLIPLFKNRYRKPDTISREIERVKRDSSVQILALCDEWREAIGRIKFHCKECLVHYRIKDSVYIQTHWYTRPSGCTEGDYWNEGEGLSECPKCKTRSCMENVPKNFQDFKAAFKSIKMEHKG